jgi:hypothetical protein
MKKMLLYLFFFLMPVVNHAGITRMDPPAGSNNNVFTAVNLAVSGLSAEIFDMALKGLQKLESEGILRNPYIITIADYSQSSNNKRLYVIDLKNRKLLFNTYVAHGRNSGGEFAKIFSNVEGSLKSSLGFFITTDPVVGSHTGYSLMISGVEKGFNDNAGKREIIIHAADYATENFIRKNGRLGRSFGCPVLPPDLNKPIIETIKGGTCLFIYNPDNEYLSSSFLLK